MGVPDKQKYWCSFIQGGTVFFLCRCQQRIKESGSFLFADILRMAVGSFQKGGICMSQQVCRHLLAGSMFQQIGGEEMPHGVQMVFLGKTVPVIQLPQVTAEAVGMNRFSLALENQPIPVGPVVFKGLLSEQFSQLVEDDLGHDHDAGAVVLGVALRIRDVLHILDDKE